MLTLLTAAFLLGLVFNAAPGPVFAETVHRSIGGGFRSALAVQIGSLAGDGLWAGFMLSSIVWAFLFGLLVDRIFRRAGRRWVRITYRFCAVAFLLLALSSLREL